MPPRPARIEYEPQVNLAVRVPATLHKAIKQASLDASLTQRDWLVAVLERAVGEAK